MTRLVLVAIFAILLIAPTANAQQQSATWIQIEAQPSLAQAQASIRRYARDLLDVNGFSLGGGWYAIALGPYSPNDALEILQAFRADRRIPSDSYIAQSAQYRQQFWPIGANLLNNQIVEPPQSSPVTESVTVTPEPEPEPSDETPRQARASERDLTREQRAKLQVALKWAGFYQGGIDAAFGRGTRNSMGQWQEANGFEATGVLTTLQRIELLRQYNAVLAGMGLKLVQDRKAGVEMMLPTSIVKFEKYDPPFAHYTSSGDIDAKVLLISQEGDQNTLTGLYDIMQTLEIVPETGPRAIDKKAFTLIGEGALFVSHTQAWLQGEQIKGFTLVWPAGDEERRTRLLTEMLDSFVRMEGALDPLVGTNEDQRIDLIAGLQIRKPKLSRSGFYVDASGAVATTAQVVQNCRKITIDEDHEAELVARDEGLGIAILRPLERLAPATIAAFRQAAPRLQSEIAVAGYSYGGVLGAPTLTFGKLADLRGLNGETELQRLALTPLEGDTGGPVLDTSGAVLGILLPNYVDGKQLPAGVNFAANVSAVQQVLIQAGITASTITDAAAIPAETLTTRATDMTVLVSCWD